MSRTPDDRKSASDLARERAAARDLIPGFVVLLVTEGSLLLADPDASESVWNLAWAMSPLVGIGLLVWGQVRVLRRSDERERVLQLTAMSIGFGVFVVLLATVGVLQSADLGNARQQTQITFIAGVVAWVAALAVLKKRTS